MPHMYGHMGHPSPFHSMHGHHHMRHHYPYRMPYYAQVDACTAVKTDAATNALAKKTGDYLSPADMLAEVNDLE